MIWEQVKFIAADSPDNALAWYDRLTAAILAIGDRHGYAADDRATALLKCETRKMVFEGTYLVFFQINEQAGVVEVIGFRHGMRLPQKGEP